MRALCEMNPPRPCKFAPRPPNWWHMIQHISQSSRTRSTRSPVALLLIPIIFGLACASAISSPTSPSVRYKDLTLSEAMTLPRHYIAQGASGSGTSITDPAPMGEIEFDGQDRTIVIVGESDVRTKLEISFLERPDRFALLHASAIHPGHPTDEFRYGSVRLDGLTWQPVTLEAVERLGGASTGKHGLIGNTRKLEQTQSGMYRADVTAIVQSFIDAYGTNDPAYRNSITCLGVIYGDHPSMQPPSHTAPLEVVAPSMADTTDGVVNADQGSADAVAVDNAR